MIVNNGWVLVVLAVRFRLDEFRLVISQHVSVSCEFSVVLSGVPAGICSGDLGQQFVYVYGVCLLIIELVLLPMKGW